MHTQCEILRNVKVCTKAVLAGRLFLADALFRAIRSEIASFAVIVDAKDENARRFYERESFLPLPDQPLKLFWPMADIAELFK